MESCVPPGFRFHPTDEELVGYYLRKKVALQKIDLDVIKEIDLYRIEPWDLQDKCGIGYEEQKEWYFFSHKDKKYPTGTRTNRATMAGFWKATGRDKAVYDKNKLIGMRKTLVFYKGRAPNGNKTDWIMHEYRLESEENGPSQEEGWVVCRAFKKRKISSQIKSTNVEGYYYGHESFGIGSVIFDSIDNITTKQRWQQQQPPQNLDCKQETEAAENLHLVQCSDQFIQLPELESPSLTVPMTKHTNYSTSEINSSEKHINDLDDKKTVRDWRDLDKFVASQLSHEDAYEGDRVSDLELLLLENGKEEVLFTTPTSDCDILEFACLINE